MGAGVAKEIVATERDPDHFEGVRLLGLTDDAASIPLLRQKTATATLTRLPLRAGVL